MLRFRVLKTLQTKKKKKNYLVKNMSTENLLKFEDNHSALIGRAISVAINYVHIWNSGIHRSECRSLLTFPLDFLF